MNKLHDLLRLVLTSQLSMSQISQTLSLSRNTVKRYRNCAREKNLFWPDIKDLNTQQLDALFNKNPGRVTERIYPDWQKCAEELEKVGVTRALLWEEYRAASPGAALSYSQFTEYLRKYIQNTKRSMRQVHLPGEKGFVDFSGKRPHYVDRQTGVVVPVELFVGCLGYSNLTFAIATASQKIPDWLSAHVAMLNYFGGSPKIIVPDNLRSAVTKSGPAPVINRTYQDLARHYDFVILPARPNKPKDKSKVEGAVKIIQRWILARLRNQIFFSLAEVNAAIRMLVDDLNLRLFKRLPGSRRSRFEEHEFDALNRLPAEHYEFAQWSSMQTVGPDYHVLVAGHWYSVPHKLVGKKVEARTGNTAVEIFYDGTRIASHARSEIESGHSTLTDHQPAGHRAYAERSSEHYQTWAQQFGPCTLEVVKAQLGRKVPALGFPACDALRKIAKQHGPEKFELAARRAIAINSLTVKSIRSILATGLYLVDKDIAEATIELPTHQNIRGAKYYSEGTKAC